MTEARHPNVVLYIALSRAPQPDNRIFIISEFIENGNLRQYIYDKKKPLPWRLRLSFAVDIVRAMSYLHARQCIHRDLKPENLLITANGRVKVTDFGFARIAAQTVEETRRLTFCGTDSYMSPEILVGEAFGLETDVYSLGIIFCELAARKLADDDTFKRIAPYYALDPAEVQRLVDPDAPLAFVDLAIACCATDRSQRPSMVEVLRRLQDIEAEFIQASDAKADGNVGSIKFLGTRGKKLDLRALVHGNANPAGVPARPANKRIPSFGMGVQVPRQIPEAPKDEPPQYLSTGMVPPPGGTGPIRLKGMVDTPVPSPEQHAEYPSEDEEDEELEAILALNGVTIPEEPLPPPTVADSEMSWRLTGWMKEYADKILPKGSASRISTNSHANMPMDASTESLIARVPLLGPEPADDDAASSNASSALTIRQTPVTQPASQEELPIADASAPKGHHQREPNATVASETPVPMDIDEPTAGAGGESYFTAHTPSTFPEQPTRAEPASTSPPTESASAPPPVLALANTSTPPTNTSPAKSPTALTEQASAPSTPKKNGAHLPPISVTPRTPPTAPLTLAQAQGEPSRRIGPSVSFESAPSTSSPRVHRFSLVRSGTWSPIDMFFGSALGTGAKCDLCSKRLGWKPCLECDDCNLTVHMKCGETAPMDCDVRGTQLTRIAAGSPPSKSRRRSFSPAPKTSSPKSNTTSPKSKSPKPHHK
ncbi:hypothetical protein DL93DRAFT_2072900 [Clavulina sp. PMI_390]|nr:hypothetical protein DL93DRAFT_2072900 [Clavulina sp. PMI_390]